MQPSPSWEALSCARNQKVSSSREPSTGPYPKRNQSSPHHPILSLKDPLQYYPLTYFLVFLIVSFLLPLAPISYINSSSPSFLLLTLPILSSFTWSFKLHLAKSKSYDAPHYVVVSSLLPLHSSSVGILSSTPCSQTSSVHVPPLMSETKFHTRNKTT
jgi:hypothetical protein